MNQYRVGKLHFVRTMLLLGFAALSAVQCSQVAPLTPRLFQHPVGILGLPFAIQDLQGTLLALRVGVVAFGMLKLLGFVPNGKLLLRKSVFPTARWLLS